MDEALKDAREAAARNEVPVGAVIAYRGTIIGRGQNSTERDTCVTSHAELVAINQACKELNNWRLNECIICVTLEPCTMCLGAIRLARIPNLVFGAGDSKQGAVGSLYDLSQDDRLGSPPRVIRGIKQVECELLLRNFFQSKR
jgi:tRNA(adenine34) deaminase